MAEDWDLYAVVRSCSSAAVNTGRDAAVGSNNNNNPNENCGSSREDPLACLASLTFEEEGKQFTFESGSLHGSYKPFLPNVYPTTIIATNPGIDPCSSSSVHGGSNGQPNHHYEQTAAAAIADVGIGTPTPLTPTPTCIFAFDGFGNQQKQQRPPPPLQQQLQQRDQPPPQTPRSRKRKNQLKRSVCHVTADNLSSDPWAWRKYGQKPIKGSPYPRNYYRCSSSKGCLARKQVERSNTDPNIFIVTYTCEHTHPKPTHRNSLAGSTRNKVSTSTVQKTATVKDSTAEAIHTNTTTTTASCYSPRSGTSLSPTTPISTPDDTVAAADNAGGDESVDMALETAPDGESDDDDLLIPNMQVDEDLFKGLEELVESGSIVGRSPTFGDNFSSWSSGNSSTTAAAAGGGR